MINLNSKTTLLYAVLVIFLSSCYATIESKKAKDFNNQLKSFYVVIKVGDNSADFSSRFSETFTKLLAEKGVSVEYEILDPLSLDSEEDLTSRIKDSNADGLMVVSQTSSTTYQNANTFTFGEQNASGGTFDIRIFVPKSKSPVWRGNLKSSTGGYGDLGNVANKTAKKLCEQLIIDKVI